MTSFIGNKDGVDYSISSLDIFSPALTQEEVSEGFWEPIAPKNTLDNRSIEFEVDTAGSLFIDPQHSYVKMKLRIVNTDNTPLVADAEVSTINYIASTLWKQVDLYMNNDLIQSSNNYHYQRKLEVELKLLATIWSIL